MKIELIRTFRDSADRLFPWLIVSTLVNGLLLLGIGLSYAHGKKTAPAPENIEVVLTRHPEQAPRPPKTALLSQSNHQSHGLSTGVVPETAPAKLADAGLENIPNQALPAAQRTLQAQSPHGPPTPVQASASGQDSAETRAQLIPQNRLERARSADDTRLASINPDGLRQKVIDSSTREYRFAAYMDQWRRKIERIGNQHYPDAARARGLTGSLILDVALLPDGSVKSIEVQQSSGVPLLDAAAKKIVHMAAPFAPFPDRIRRDTDVLHIVRTWNFSNNRMR